MKKVTSILLSLVIVFVLVACGDPGGYDPSKDYTEIKWPSSELVSRLPVPESLLGEINSESADYFNIDLGSTNEQYNAYVEACQEAGFTVDYQKNSSTFYAYDTEGYYVLVTYYENWKEMSITIRSPQDDESQEDTATTTTAKATTTTTKKVSHILGEEFKNAMDSYEKFMDDYVAFMKKYQANPYDLGLIADYAEFMSNYADMMADFESWEDEDLNDAEIAYYIDVQARVSQKLLEVAN